MIKNLKARKLLQKILVKDPEKRATLEEIQQDEWLVKEGEDI
jgi:serine/threonine protein kinase